MNGHFNCHFSWLVSKGETSSDSDLYFNEVFPWQPLATKVQRWLNMEHGFHQSGDIFKRSIHLPKPHR